MTYSIETFQVGDGAWGYRIPEAGTEQTFQPDTPGYVPIASQSAALAYAQAEIERLTEQAAPAPELPALPGM